jgi:PAS domain S-box-containing protein
MSDERRAVLWIVLVYAVVAALWIALSDRAVEWLFREPAMITEASTAKGWLFVAVTSLLLYALVLHLTHRIETAHEAELAVRAERQQALRDGEARFRAVVEQTLAGIYIIQDRRFRYVNPGFAAIFGYDSPASVIDSVPIEDLVGPDDRARVAENVRKRLDGEVKDIHYTFTGLRRDGRPIDVEVHGRAFEYEGRPAVIGFLLDITARKTAEDALRKSELRFHDIVRATGDWVWEVDAEGRFTFASEGVRDLLGYAPTEIIGRTPFDFMPPEEASRVGAEFAAVAAQRRPFRDLDNINIRKDGSAIHVSTSGVPILGANGQLLGYRGIDSDITARKAAEEELRQRNDELERFNRAAIDRELDMIELKKRINALTKELGRTPPYPLAFLTDESQP